MGLFDQPSRKKAKAGHRQLRFEPLDPRRVLSANSVTFEAPSEFSDLFGSESVIDVVGDRTTYRSLETIAYEGAPDVAAMSFLTDHAESFGLPVDVADSLSVIDTKFGIASSHAYFQQTYAGLPIVGAQVTVSMDGSRSIQTLHSSFVEHTDAGLNRNVGLKEAVELAERHAGVKETWFEGDVEAAWSLNDDGVLEPAWQMMVHASAPQLQDLFMVVSAVDGEVVSLEDRSAHATGTGNVFEPNPYQTQGSGANMVDNNDATSAALDAQMISVTLERLNDGTGLLQGEWVDVTLPGGLNVPLANETSRVYEYDRDDPRFEQVVVYHAVDQIQEYFHTLGFDDDTGTANGIRDFPTMANSHGFEADQSFYSLANDAIHFGDGGVDDGEDADIIAHEYGHAIQHDQNPNWGGGEMGAMGEGFGDYLAASFYADIGDVGFQSAHAAAVGEWDAVSYSNDSPPNLRRVDGNKSYPGDLVGQVHADGEIWSASLWDIRAQLGGPTTDQLVLESHFGLPGGASMIDAANAILQADANLNGGVNQAAIQGSFVARGILTAPDDHGNFSSDATALSVPGTGSGQIDYANDLDYFSFNAVAGTTYEIEVALGSSSDSTVTLFGTNGSTQIGFDDNGGVGNGSLIPWTAPSSGVYFAAVSGVSTASIGTYEISIDTTTTPADDHGDVTGNATAVANPSLTAGTIEAASDADVFAFTADAGSTYTSEVVLGSLENSFLTIVDTNGSTVIASDTDGGSAQLIWSAGASGTYYAVVEGGSQGTYEFEIEELSDDHGNNAASATPIAVPGTTDGWIEFDADRDWFSFEAVAGINYEFTTALGTITDTVMWLYGPNGTTEIDFDDDGGPGLASSIRWLANTNGTHYVAVGGFSDARTGTYELTATESIPGVDDHGNIAGDATPIALNSTVDGDIEEFADADYFSFTVPAGADVVLATTLGSITDTTLTLYDTNGTTQLEFNDDDPNGGLDSRIEWTASTSGTYFAAVRGFADARTGTYSLEVTSSIVGVTGDFDGDGDWDCSDIDGLVSQVAGGAFDASFDMDANGVLDIDDVGEWLAVAGANNLASGNPHLPGDANLDGVVDTSDFNVWNDNKFTSTAAWCSGDFNADGSVDTSDFNVWNANKFTASRVAGDIVPQAAFAAGGVTEAATGQVDLLITEEFDEHVDVTPVVAPVVSANQGRGSVRTLHPVVVDVAFLDESLEETEDQVEKEFFLW